MSRGPEEAHACVGLKMQKCSAGASGEREALNRRGKTKEAWAAGPMEFPSPPRRSRQEAVQGIRAQRVTVLQRVLPRQPR